MLYWLLEEGLLLVMQAKPDSAVNVQRCMVHCWIRFFYGQNGFLEQDMLFAYRL